MRYIVEWYVNRRWCMTAKILSKADAKRFAKSLAPMKVRFREVGKPKASI